MREGCLSSRFLLTTCVVLLFSAMSGCGGAQDSIKFSSDEQARVTSPDGLHDAVLLRLDGGGAPGGWEWCVYIADKGKPPAQGIEYLVFNAGTLTGAKLIWKESHLLDIRYDIADINHFRNLWVGHQDAGNATKDYLVEIRLAPTSQDFSLLNSDGTYKSRD